MKMGLLIKLIIIVVLFAVAANLFFVFSVQKEAENVFLEYGENEIIPAKNQKVKNKIVPVTCREGKVKKVVSNCVDGDGDGCDACDVTNNGVPIPGCFCNILNTNTPHPNCECDEDDSDDGFQCQINP